MRKTTQEEEGRPGWGKGKTWKLDTSALEKASFVLKVNLVLLRVSGVNVISELRVYALTCNDVR